MPIAPLAGPSPVGPSLSITKFGRDGQAIRAVLDLSLRGRKSLRSGALIMNEAEKLDLQGSLSVPSIATLHDQVCQAMNAKAEQEVDMSAVTDVDASAVQLLLAAKKRAAEQKSTFELKMISDRVKSAMSLAGVLDSFEADTEAQ